MQESSKVSINEVIPSKLGKGGVFISNLKAAQDPKTLIKHNIRAVISVAKGKFLQHSKELLPNYLYIPASDHPDFDIAEFFRQSYQFMEKASKKTNILVHCKAGISRSATIVIAYLMRKQNKSWVQAYRQIKQLRPIIQPNNGFLRQLKDFQDNILNKKFLIFAQNKNKDTKKILQKVSKQSQSNINYKQNLEIKIIQPNQPKTQRPSSSFKSKLKHRNRLRDVSQKRASIPYAINY